MTHGSISMDKRIFFCFGPPKSGTTFLQRTLDLHPEISCPSEHNFDFLMNSFTTLFEQYDKVLELVDLRTGGQGTTPISKTIQYKLFSDTVKRIIWDSSQGKRIAGANDNEILNKIEFYNTLFDTPLFISIFRNPIDTAISAWYYNLKLAEIEENEQHKLLMTKHGGLPDWIKHIAKKFNIEVKKCMEYMKDHRNILIVKYEDLLNNKKNVLFQLFGFLGASTEDQILNRILEHSSFSSMRNASIRKDFYRSGKTDMGKGMIDGKLRKEVSIIASTGLQALGYDLFCD